MRRKLLARTALQLTVAFIATSGFPFVSNVDENSRQPNGNLGRTQLTYTQLMSRDVPAQPVDDSVGFAAPANAVAPTQEFEGTLTLVNPTANGKFDLVKSSREYDVKKESPWVHLPEFSFEFVQNGTRLIPAKQGLVITGSPAWNYILGPGRVWSEETDHGYMRASFPFAIVERNQNCVHNGEMTFLFNRGKKPNVSKVYYQITQETCLFFKVNMWGLLEAEYQPRKVPNAEEIKHEAIQENERRLPTKPLADLKKDFPQSNIDLTGFTKPFKSPGDITTYGVVVNGTNYVSGCPTRFGEYAFCDQMRLPSYSVAKSSFAGMGLMWLGQKYGPSVYRELIRNYVPEYVEGGDWSKVTFNDASDMATGNFIDSGFEADEDGPKGRAFIDAESYKDKIHAAIAPFPHKADPGTTWIYQTFATFILTQGMNGFLQEKEGASADIFNSYRDSVFKPLNMSQGSLTTVRTDNSASGRPFGGYGLFFIQDDVAKIGRFLNNDGGANSGRSILDPQRVRESLFRTMNPGEIGVPIPDRGKPVAPNTFRYHNQFWAKHVTPTEFPQYKCDFWVPFMSGYGGISVVLLPNGVTYYIFSDGNEFVWYSAMNELNKIAPLCK